MPEIELLSKSESAGPLALLLRWRNDSNIVMLHSGDRHARFGRWSVIAQPRGWYRFDGRSSWVGKPPRGFEDIKFAHDPLEDVDALVKSAGTAVSSTPHEHPLPGGPGGGWVGYLAYELGAVIEPRAKQSDRHSRERRPLIELAWCPDALVFDHAERTWFTVGDLDPAELIGEPHDAVDDSSIDAQTMDECGFEISDLRSVRSPDAHLHAIARTLEYIRAGDIFQANITQAFTAQCKGSTRALAAGALASSGARYGAYLELPDDRFVVSMSPELFLSIDGSTRKICTRPIKGTRPGHLDPRELQESVKDAAELHMIVDLMRNDLGRVCEFGSVRVDEPRMIESHPTVHHGVAHISGTLRSDISIGEVLRATFPAGSITGAPKIRAMQIIDELESRPRGIYCGSIGWIGADGSATFNVAIRTALIENNILTYGAGGGIVADSSPADEYRESIDKTAVLREVIQNADVMIV